MATLYQFTVIEDPAGYELFTVDIEVEGSIEDAREEVKGKVEETIQLDFPWVKADDYTTYRIELENIHVK